MSISAPASPPGPCRVVKPKCSKGKPKSRSCPTSPIPKPVPEPRALSTSGSSPPRPLLSERPIISRHDTHSLLTQSPLIPMKGSVSLLTLSPPSTPRHLSNQTSTITTPQIENTRLTPCSLATLKSQDDLIATTPLPHNRPTKRPRPNHDVDGPQTSLLSSKKRRLRRYLITSRLSRPFSSPASYISNRENENDDSPVMTRFLRNLGSAGGGSNSSSIYLAAAGGASVRKAGHQTNLVRKAAILNRVRINVRNAAVARGNTQMAGMALLQNVMHHGLQLVTAGTGVSGGNVLVVPASGADMRRGGGMVYYSGGGYAAGGGGATRGRGENRERGESPGSGTVKETKRSNDTTIMNAEGVSAGNSGDDHGDSLGSITAERARRRARSPFLDREMEIDDGDDDTAFPTSSYLNDRYADFSDDDMDDVYADFGVLFGSPSSPGRNTEEGGPRSDGGYSDNEDYQDEATEGSHHARPRPNPHGQGQEHYLEEYLDEVDGIPWSV